MKVVSATKESGVELYFAEVQVGLPPSLPAVVFPGRAQIK
jgi:hypothetical protein